MNNSTAPTTTTSNARSVVIEREFAHPPERIWRALTQPHLIAEWLMQNDFRPEVGHRFGLTAEWGSVDCRVLEIEPERSLSYTWDAFALESVVTWTLTPVGAGTRLRMEQSGSLFDKDQAYHGARMGWRRFIKSLADVVERNA